MVVESGVCSMPVVVVKEGGEVGGADAGVLVGTSVSPFPQRGLDKAFIALVWNKTRHLAPDLLEIVRGIVAVALTFLSG
jgi:hypothetical protein